MNDVISPLRILLRERHDAHQEIGHRAREARGAAEAGFYGSIVPARPNFYEILELATIKGAEAMGLDKEVGSLEPGKKADIITFNMENPHLMPAIEPVTSIILYGTSADIDTVIIEGKILKENGAMKGVELNKAKYEAREVVEDIWDKWFEDYPEIKSIYQSNIPYKKY